MSSRSVIVVVVAAAALASPAFAQEQGRVIPEPSVSTDFITRGPKYAPEQFKTAMKNLGQDVAYLDQAEFKAFWDADAKRVEDAVNSIGKVQG